MFPPMYRLYIYLAAIVIAFAAAISVLLGWFTPEQIEAALVVLGLVFAAVAGLAARNVPPE